MEKISRFEVWAECNDGHTNMNMGLGSTNIDNVAVSTVAKVMGIYDVEHGWDRVTGMNVGDHA